MKRYGASISPWSIPAVVKKESVAPSGLRTNVSGLSFMVLIPAMILSGRPKR